MRETKFFVMPSEVCEGECTPPADKSISHRALLISAMANGESQIKNLLYAEDIEITIDALRKLGVPIAIDPQGKVTVTGVGISAFSVSKENLSMGNSGTTTRLLCGMLAGNPFTSKLYGDASLTKRPMERIATPLRTIGASIQCSEHGTLPITVQGKYPLRAFEYPLQIPSAQIKSAMLFAALHCQEVSTIKGRLDSRDHTERMLQSFGAKLLHAPNKIAIDPAYKLIGNHVEIPGDISSAAFMLVAAVIARRASLMLRSVGINPSRKAIIDVLTAMGAKITLTNRQELGIEPVADIVVEHAPLYGYTIPAELVSNVIDELPVIMIAAAVASGTTKIFGAKELRVKESDRIAAMRKGLETIGVTVEETDDGIIIQGGEIKGGTIESFGDHRIAMSFATAGFRATKPIVILNTDCVQTSFPHFERIMRGIGLDIEKR